MSGTQSKIEAYCVDAYVGRAIKQRRVSIGMSLTVLSELIGNSYQQTHKYEEAINRVPAGKLYRIARALGVVPRDLLPAVTKSIETDAAADLLNAARELDREKLAIVLNLSRELRRLAA